MNKTDLISKINASSISDARKAEILALIEANELDEAIMDQIKDIMQEDIDENVSEMLSDDQKKGIETIENNGASEIKAIATEVADDVKYVEDEMADLEASLDTLNPVLDQIAIDEVKTNLDQAAE